MTMTARWGSLAELAYRLLQQRTGHAWRLARAEQIRFRHFVRPGDQMDLRVELKEFSPAVASFGASVRVEDRVVSTIRKLQLIPREAVAP